MEDLAQFDFSFEQAIRDENARWVHAKKMESIGRTLMLDNLKRRIDSIIASPEEIAAAEQRYRDAHPEPERIPVVSETDLLMQPYSKEYLAMLDRALPDAETADRVTANEVMGDLEPSLVLAHVAAFEKTGGYPKSTPQSGLERVLVGQKSLPVMHAPHGWTDSTPDSETRTIREYYEKDRRN